MNKGINVNVDLLDYFGGDTKGRPFLSELSKRTGIINTIIGMLKMLCDYPDNKNLDRRKTLIFYEDLARVYKIPFPPFFINVLFDVEEGDILGYNYRDHILHLFYVFCLGCYIFDSSRHYNILNEKEAYDCMANWVVAAFLHDIGYIFCGDGNISLSKALFTLEEVVCCKHNDLRKSFDNFWFWLLAITNNGQPEFAIQGSVANSIHKVSPGDLNKAFPLSVSIKKEEICSFFAKYNCEDIYDGLPDIGYMGALSGRNISIKNFCYYNGRVNHGILSSLLLIYSLKARTRLLSNSNLPIEILDLNPQM